MKDDPLDRELQRCAEKMRQEEMEQPRWLDWLVSIPAAFPLLLFGWHYGGWVGVGLAAVGALIFSLVFELYWAWRRKGLRHR